MNLDDDPRVFFASERTLLAWLRTGLSVIGLGFVVAKFGWLVRLAAPNAQDLSKPIASTVLGIAFVILGSAAVGVAAWQHARFIARMKPSQKPEPYIASFAVWASAATAAAGIALAVYLAVA